MQQHTGAARAVLLRRRIALRADRCRDGTGPLHSSACGPLCIARRNELNRSVCVRLHAALEHGALRRPTTFIESGPRRRTLLLVGYSEPPRRAREQLAYVRQFSPRRARSASDADEFKLDLLHRMLDGAKEVTWPLPRLHTNLAASLPSPPLTSSRVPPRSLHPPAHPLPLASVPGLAPAPPALGAEVGPLLPPRGMRVGSAWHARARERILRDCAARRIRVRCDAMRCDALPTKRLRTTWRMAIAFTLQWRRMAASVCVGGIARRWADRTKGTDPALRVLIPHEGYRFSH